MSGMEWDCSLVAAGVSLQTLERGQRCAGCAVSDVPNRALHHTLHKMDRENTLPLRRLIGLCWLPAEINLVSMKNGMFCLRPGHF